MKRSNNTNRPFPRPAATASVSVLSSVVRAGLVLLLLLSHISVSAQEEGEDAPPPTLEDYGEFKYPNPEDYNITITPDTNWTSVGGYNPWMPQYVGDGTGNLNDNSTDTDNDTTEEPIFVLLTGGCLNEDELGSATAFIDVAVAWRLTCADKNMTCLCRPLVDPQYWNVNTGQEEGSVSIIDQEAAISINQGLHYCSWEIRRVLDEYKRGIIKNLGGIAAQCGHYDPYIYEEAKLLGVPIYLIDVGKPEPPIIVNEEDGTETLGIYTYPEPNGYIGIDNEFLGQSMGKLLKQLRPEGGTYAFVMQWERLEQHKIREAFNQEMIVPPSDKDKKKGSKNKNVWKEVYPYPYERPYNTSIPCPLKECMFDGLLVNTTVTAVMFLYERPLRQDFYFDWVKSMKEGDDRNTTFISLGTRIYLEYLDQGYLDGLISQNRFDVGTKCATILFNTHNQLQSGKLTFEEYSKRVPVIHETGLVSNNVIPLNLDKVYPPILELHLLGNLIYVGYVAFGIIQSTSLLCCIWTIKYKNEMVVKATQPFFLLILIFGIVILSCTIIPLSFDDNGGIGSGSDDEEFGEGSIFAVGVCMSQPWLAFTGFTVIFAALFSKTWRVNKLFRSSTHHSRVTVSPKDVFAPFAVTFTCNVIILTCWTILDPLTYTRLVGSGTDLWNRQIESYGVCRSENAIAYLLPLAVVNFIVLGIACWQAFEGRAIESAFAESKYIGFAVASLFQAFLTGFPIMVTVKDEPRSFYLVLTLTIFVLCEGILVLIFLPKMILVRQFSKLSEADQRKELSEQIQKSTRGYVGNNASGSISLRGSTPFHSQPPISSSIASHGSVGGHVRTHSHVST